jgi:hypothetical protein
VREEVVSVSWQLSVGKPRRFAANCEKKHFSGFWGAGEVPVSVRKPEILLPFAKKALLRHHESFDSSSTELAPDSLNSSFVGTDH